jgi:carboxypeptidase Taq
MSNRFPELLSKVRELKDLDGVLSLMGWDEETYAPRAGRAPRGRHTATLEGLRHERLTSPALGALIEELVAEPSLDDAQRTMVARIKHRRDRAVKVPEALVRAFAEARSLSLAAWGDARKADDYASFRPHLETIVRLSRERADALGGERYDALLDEYEPGMTKARLIPILAELREGLVPLVRAIAAKKAPDRSFLIGPAFDEELQWQLTLRLLGDLGFDLERGRQDRSAHPFTNTVSEHDVRVTTRIFADNPLSAIFSTIHEAGHGMYEQGFDAAHHGTPLADAPSMGIHESQSRLWENQVGRSRAFWSHYLPELRRLFPAQLGGVELDAFYRAVNVVEPGLIRVDADEVTYNLHILLRFELEIALLSGDLVAKDLPGAWNEKMRAYLGVAPPNDADGCMQDIHWAWGAIGYFPTYSLGNAYSAQLMAAFVRETPDAWGAIGRGNLGVLLSWLRGKVHRSGYLHSAEETVRRATGEALSVKPLLEYLKKKYSEVYGL